MKAEANTSNLAPADLHRATDTSADFYAGTKEQLVSSGLCKAEWFPKKLTLEFCKDGSPKLGNSGRQRVTRVYAVEGSDPAITLTHRTDAEKREYWWVRIDVSDAEHKKREAARHAKWEEGQRLVEAAQRERAAEAAAALPIVSQLRRRYPDLDIGGAISRRDGKLVQSLEFRARDLATLQRLGVVTSEMLEERHRNGEWHRGDLPDGRSFFICNYGHASNWQLILHTPEAVRERKYFPVTEARRVLKLIAAGDSQSPPPS